MQGVLGKIGRIGWLALALLALVNGGCLLAVAGAAGAAGAAGYFYYNGLLYRDYHANLADTMAAVRRSLIELQFPISEEKTDTGSAFLKTRTSDGYTVRIYLDMVPSPIPAEGAITRIGIRVGYSGDEAVSARILDQVSRHLIPPTVLPSPPPTTLGAQLGPPRSVIETPPPPLATISHAPTSSATAPLRPISR
jgi:hypothetical protein